MPTIDAATVRAVFEADIADLVANTKRAADSVERMANKTDESGQRMSKGIGLAGAAIATALAGAAKASIDNTLAFEKSMTSISALVGATDQEMAQYTETVRRVGTETGVGAKQAADAMYFLTSSGLDAATAMDTLEVTAKASAAGLGEQARLADVVSSAMNAYADSGMTAGKATDIMVAAVREGKIEASEFASEIGTAIPQAAQLGISFDQVSAAVAGMSLTGMKAGEAVTRLEYAMRSMASPSVRAEKVLAEFGLSGEMLRATIREKGLLPALNQLREAFKGNEDQMVRGLGSIQAYQAVMSLTGENSEQVAAIFEEVAASSGDLDTAFGKVAETSGHKLSVAMAELQDASIDVGATLVPVAATVVSSLSGMVSGFSDMSSGVQVALVSVLAIVPAIGTAQKAIEGLQSVWGGMQKAFAGGAMAGPVGLGLAAGAGLAAFAYMEMKENAEEARAKQEALTAALVAGQDPTFVAAQRYTELVASLATIPAAAGDATDALKDNVGGTKFVADQIGAEWGEAFARIGHDAGSLWEIVRDGTDVFGELEKAGPDKWGRVIESGLKGATDAQRDLIQSMYDAVAAGDMSQGTMQDMIQELDRLADSSDDARESLLDQAKADVGLALSKDASLKPIIDQALAQSQATDELGRYHDALAAVENVNKMFTPVDMAPTTEGMGDAAEATLEMEQAEKDAEEATKALDDAFKEMNKTIDNYLGAVFNIDAAIDDQMAGIYELAEGFAKNGTALDGYSKAAIDNRQMLADWVSGSKDIVTAMAEQNKSTDEQTGALAGMSASLAEVMRQAGFSEEAIAHYTGVVMGIPVGSPGLDAQNAQLAEDKRLADEAAAAVGGVGSAAQAIDGTTATVTVTANTAAAYEALNAFYSAAVTTTGNIWTQINSAFTGVNNVKAHAATRPWENVGPNAEGGHIGPGQFGTAGEDGPELLVGRNGGVDIIPMDQIAGSGLGLSGAGGMKGGAGDTYIIQAHPDSRGQYEARRVYDGLSREKRRRGGELAVTG